MVRPRQVTILAMAGSVAKSRLLRLACESIERICETGDVWPGPACTRPMRGVNSPKQSCASDKEKNFLLEPLVPRMRAQTVIQQRARVGLGTRSSTRRRAKNRRLEHVMVNLLTNAVKHTDDGGQIWPELDKEGDECVNGAARGP
jgi:signal transduction histidine kinase